MAKGGHDESQQGAAAGPDQGHQLAEIWNFENYESGEKNYRQSYKLGEHC